MTVVKVMDVISTLQGCAGETVVAVSAYTQVKMEDAPKILKSRIGVSRRLWFVYHDRNDLNHGPEWKTQLFPTSGICTVHPLAGLLRERQFEKILFWCMEGRRLDRENRQEQLKNYHGRKIFVSLRGLAIGTILWVGEQDDSTILQSLYSLHSWPSFQRRKNSNPWEIFQKYTLFVPQMLVLGSYWKTWYSPVREQLWTKDLKMDQSVWQAIMSFDLLHSAYMWIQTVFPDGKRCQTMQSGTVSRLRVYLFPQVGCVRTKLQFRIVQQKSKSFRWMQQRLDGKPALDLWDLMVEFLGSTNQSHTERGDLFLNKCEVCSTTHTQCKKEDIFMDQIFTQHYFSLTRQLFHWWIFGVCVLKDNEVRQWDMFPESTEFRDPNQIRWDQEPSRRCIDKRVIVLKWWNAERCRWYRSHSKNKTDDEFGLTTQLKGFERACLDCIGKPEENQIWNSESTCELLIAQQTLTGRLVKDASSASYWEWDDDEKLFY